MRPPARTTSAARRMRRGCGSTGCNSGYSAIACACGKSAARGSRTRRMTIYAALCRRIATLSVSDLSPSMQALSALAPLAAFFVTYSLRGLYAATAVLMAAMVALLAFDWLRQRRIIPMHALSAVLVLIFGSATLLLHNRLYIQWKPTVLCWLVSAAFVGSFW